MPEKNIEVLLIEDSAVDARLTERLFGRLNIPHRLHLVRDGEEAIKFLEKTALVPEKYWPDLILLDLNLPRRSGYEVLEAIKKHPSLKIIPVIVMTTSDQEEDIRRCYELQANAYITKPDSLHSLLETLLAIEAFWLRSVKLPSPRF